MIVASGAISESENARLFKAYPQVFNCGPKAAYILLKLQKCDVQLSEILRSGESGTQGISLLELKELLENHGLPSQILKCSPKDLSSLSTPYIMYTYPPETDDDIGHFVVVLSVDEMLIRVIDASTGLEKIYQRHKISNIWNGIIIAPKGGASQQWVVYLAVLVTLLLCIYAYLIIDRRGTQGRGTNP